MSDTKTNNQLKPFLFIILYPYVPYKTLTQSHHNEVTASIGDISKSFYCALACEETKHIVFLFC